MTVDPNDLTQPSGQIYASATPYPYGEWQKVSRADVMLLRQVARAVPRNLGHACRILSDLVGAPAHSRGGTLHPCSPEDVAPALIEPLACIVLVSSNGPHTRLVLELTPSLAAGLIDRLLGGEGQNAPGVSLSDGERGAMAFATARILSEQSSRSPSRPQAWNWKVATVFTTKDAVLEAIGHEGALVWSTELQVGDLQGVVRAWIPRRLAPDLVAVAIPPLALRLTCVVDVGQAELAESDLRSLRTGDVLLLDPIEGWAEGEWRARILGARRTAWWIAPTTNKVLRVEQQNEPSSQPGALMSGDNTQHTSDTVVPTTDEFSELPAEDTNPEVVLAAVGDAPVTLSVELGRVTLSLEEIARISPGEVVLTKIAVGDDVRLRAGEHIIASGELVNVDGEIGVRIKQIQQ